MPTTTNLPTIVSFAATDPLATDAGVVHYRITFSNVMTGVTADQFSLITTGSLSGAAVTSITPVAGSAVSYDIAVASGIGEGTLTLELTGSAIRDVNGNPLSQFKSESGYAAPVGVSGDLAFGDLNGNGLTDLLLVARSTTVMLNDGAGGFKAPVIEAWPSFIGAVALADLNGDGKLDMVFADGGTRTANVRFGNGDGTFAAPASYAAGTYPFDFTLGDFNGDGKTDLLVTSPTMTVLAGNGDGSFQAPVATALAIVPTTIGVADFDGDGKLDAIVSSVSGTNTTLSLLHGNGNGTFQSPLSIGSYAFAVQSRIGDFNGDGKLDLAVTYSSSMAILLGNGDGTFAAAANFKPPTSMFETGDVNGDGKTDLVFTTSSKVSYSLGRGDGTFETAVTLPWPVTQTLFGVADLNGDGKSDVVMPGTDGTTTVLLSNPVEPAAPVYTLDRSVPPLMISDADVTPGGDGRNYINAAHFHGGTTTLVGTGNPSEVITLTNAIDNTVIGSTIVTGDGNWSVNLSGMVDGSTYSYVAMATDTSGNSRSSSIFTFTVDTTGPAVAVTGIEAGQAPASGYNVSGTVDPADAPARLLFVTRNASSGRSTVTAVSASDGSWLLTDQNIGFGNTFAYLSVQATDAAGNVSATPEIELIHSQTLSGSTATSNAIVLVNGILTVQSGGSAIDTTVFRQGIEAVQGGTSTGSVVQASALQHVYGGIVTAATIEAGAYQDIRYTATATDTVLSGFEYVYGGSTAVHTTVKAGGRQFVDGGGHATNTVIELSGSSQIATGGDEHGATVYGSLFVNGASYSATIGAGGSQYVYGTATGAQVTSGGSQHVYQGGTADGTTVAAGGYQDIYQSTVTNTVLDGNQQVLGDGHAAGTVINAGGRQYVGSGGATTGTTIAADGFQYLDAGATDGSATINGGYQFVAGVATATTVRGGGEQDVGAGGNISNVHLDGGSEHVYAGGLLQNVDFGGSDGATLVLDAPAGLSGSIADFGADDHIDFRNTVISSVDVDGANNLTVTTDGGQSYSWALLAQYSASSFVLTSDGNGGTALNYVPPQQPQLAAAH